MGKQKQLFGLIALSVSMAACSPLNSQISAQIAKDVQSGSACNDFHGKITSTLSQALLDEAELPSEGELRDILEAELQDNDQKSHLIDQVLAVYRTLTLETKDQLGLTTNAELIGALVGLELGDQTTPEKKNLKGKLKAQMNEIQLSAKNAGLDCAPPPTEEPEAIPPVAETPPLEEPPVPIKETTSLPVKGAVRVLATAYQSCQAIRLPAMTDSTTPVHPQAIKITGTHSNGVGLKREVGNLPLLQSSHYYIREGIEKDSSCFNVPQNPLIYDYGGKPYATTATSSSLDLFRNGGTGTSVLGIDCSGYVFSALAVSGMRLTQGKKLTAFQVNGVNSRMYMDPVPNGLSCLAPVTSTPTNGIANGDILASTGHVVMIDRVGTDPFGIARLRSAADCTSANVSHRNFDFDILHSAPIKNGVGLNRSRASYYLSESSGMRNALIEYGVAACKARFGQPSTIKPASARLVRHKMTPDCMDTPIRMERESCVRTCVASL